MVRIGIFFKHYWLAILSGVLMGTSYIPLPPWALLFAFTPLWFQVLEKSQNWRQAFLAGWLSQFVLSLIGFHWIAYVSHEYGYLPWSISLLTLLLFAATVHSYYAFAAAIGYYLRKRFSLSSFSSLVVLVSLVNLAEAFWPSLFPWNLGYPWLTVKLPIFQTADTIGFLGLSLLTHASGAGLCWCLLARQKPKLWRARLTWFAGTFLLISGSLIIWGQHQYQRWSQTDQSLKVLQIQANIGNMEKYYAEKGAGFQQEIVNQFFDLTRKAKVQFPTAELIIWPESAYPDALNSSEHGRNYPDQFFNFVREIKTPLLTGAFSKDPPFSAKRKEYNGLFLFDSEAKQVAPPYHKTYLLAYGEYTPFAELFPWMAQLSPAGAGFARGPGPTVIPFGESKIGLQICYESLYPEFTEHLSKQGADWLVNLTNDSWFGNSFEPWQHLYMTLARGVESRRPLVRSTNTGITSAILANGEILQKSPAFQTWFGQYEIKFLKSAPQTFYVTYGSWLPALIFLFILLSLILGQQKPHD